VHEIGPVEARVRARLVAEAAELERAEGVYRALRIVEALETEVRVATAEQGVAFAGYQRAIDDKDLMAARKWDKLIGRWERRIQDAQKWLDHGKES